MWWSPTGEECTRKGVRMKRRGALRGRSRECRSLQTSDRTHCYFMSTWCIRCYQWRSCVKIQLVRKKGDKKGRVNPQTQPELWQCGMKPKSLMELYNYTRWRVRNSFNSGKLQLIAQQRHTWGVHSSTCGRTELHRSQCPENPFGKWWKSRCVLMKASLLLSLSFPPPLSCSLFSNI